MSRLLSRSFAAFLMSALPLAAQTSSLQGLVTDGQSSAVPDAVVIATKTDTAASRKTLTAANGSYTTACCKWLLENTRFVVEKPGFRTDAAETELLVETPATLNVQLSLGAVTETVNVMAETTAINTQNAAIGSPFNEVQVKELPLQTRNVVALLGVQAGRCLLLRSGVRLASRPKQRLIRRRRRE